MMPAIHDYHKLRAAFRWDIPARYNIGAASRPPRQGRTIRR
jgi:hypothetical protein